MRHKRQEEIVAVYGLKFDAHVKSPFYMDLGIQVFRNCELLKAVSPKGVTKYPELSDFLRDHQN